MLSQKPKTLRQLKCEQNDCYGNVLQSCDKIQKESDFLGVQISMRTFNSREKSKNTGGGIPTDSFIPKATES